MNVRLTELLEQLLVGSTCRRVDTDDTERITANGIIISSGWQRYTIVERVDESDEYPYGSVRVQYADDAEDDEPLIYDIVEFVNNTMIVPKHVVDLAADVNLSLRCQRGVNCCLWN